MIKSGQEVTKRFTITDPTGALVDADSLPTATLLVGGINDDAIVTVTNISTGKYKIVCTIPESILDGTSIELEVNAVIGGISTAHVFYLDTVTDDIGVVSDGVEVTQDTIGTDDLAIGRVQPYATIYAYIDDELQYKFTEVADADGDFSIKLPAGSTWKLVACRPPLYENTEAEVTL